MLRAINVELARCDIRGYVAQHRTSSGENGIAVTDLSGQALPRPAGGSRGRALLRLLRGLDDGCGVAAYSVAVANADAHWLYV